MLGRILGVPALMIKKAGQLVVKERTTINGKDCIVLQLNDTLKKEPSKNGDGQRLKFDFQYRFTVEIKTKRILKLEIGKRVKNYSRDIKNKLNFEYEGVEDGTVSVKYITETK